MHLRDLGSDFLGGLGRLGSKCLDLGSNDRKTPPGLTGAGSLDCSVQREQVGLLGHCRNQFHDFTDAIGRLRELGDPFVGLLRLTHGGVSNVFRLLNLSTDFADRGSHLLGCSSRRLRISG